MRKLMESIYPDLAYNQINEGEDSHADQIAAIGQLIADRTKDKDSPSKISTNAFVHMFRHEGLTGLYRALPVTLLTNLPYGAVMVTTNEALRGWLMGSDHGESAKPQLTIQTTLIAGSGAGMGAAAVTAPLDRLKTKLQTQGLAVAHTATSAPSLTPQYKGLVEAFESVVRHEGYIGLFRGVVPRVVTHTPSVAISWTVYEVMKVWLSTSATTTG